MTVPRTLGPRNPDIPAFIDIGQNLEIGAAILKDSLGRGGSLWHRISNYHMGGARERERYNQQVYDAYLRYMHGKIRRGSIR